MCKQDFQVPVPCSVKWDDNIPRAFYENVMRQGRKFPDILSMFK